jgi:hypothetical protein
MATQATWSVDQDVLLARIEALTCQLDAMRSQLDEVQVEPRGQCTTCRGELRQRELSGGMCRPCRHIRDMMADLARLRTTTEMTLLMATEISDVTGRPRHAILDRIQRKAVSRIADADATVAATRVSA